MLSDSQAFWDAATQARGFLYSASPELAGKFDDLLKKMPDDFFDVRLGHADPASGEAGVIVIEPGPRLEAILDAGRRLFHELRMPPTGTVSELDGGTAPTQTAGQL